MKSLKRGGLAGQLDTAVPGVERRSERSPVETATSPLPEGSEHEDTSQAWNARVARVTTLVRVCGWGGRNLFCCPLQTIACRDPPCRVHAMASPISTILRTLPVSEEPLVFRVSVKKEGDTRSV